MKKFDFLTSFSVGIIAYGGAYFVLITFIPIPKENIRFADTILGFLCGAAIGTILTYWYGTSKSSQDKSEWFRDQNKKPVEKNDSSIPGKSEV
jgi:hypothetical protein